MSSTRLPEGHLNSWDLHVEHHPVSDAGAFTGGGWKLVWHTTEGSWQGGFDILSQRDSPHFMLGWKPGHGRDDFTAVQFIELDRAAKALEHPNGTAETNRANAIQVELVGFAKDAPKWGPLYLRAIAALACLIEHRVPVPRKAPRAFSTTPNRYSGAGFVRAAGHVGHQHAASQPLNHWDPGAFPVKKVLRLMADIDH